MVLRNFFIAVLILKAIVVNAQYSDFAYTKVKNSEALLAINAEQMDLNYSFSTTDFNNSLNRKADKNALERSGKALTLVGIPLFIVGAVLASGGEKLFFESTNARAQGGSEGVGMVLLGTGVCMSGIGIVLWTIGKNRK